MNHKTVRTPGVWLQLLRSSSADGFSLLFCCKHCRLQHNTHTPEPAVCLYLQMSSNYNCERFAEGKSRVGRKKTEKRAERTGNEQRVQGEEKKRKKKSIRKEGKDEKLPHLDSCHVNPPHTHLVSMIVKKLCNNLLSLYDGFLICFTRGFQSHLWLRAKRSGQKAFAGALTKKKRKKKKNLYD